MKILHCVQRGYSDGDSWSDDPRSTLELSEDLAFSELCQNTSKCAATLKDQQG